MSELQKMLLFGGLVLAALAVFAVMAAFSSEPVETFMFYTLAATMVVSSLAIVLTRNIIRAATWLLGTLGSAAGLFLLLSANFLAAIQLIVYAGGILILIVFGVMLTAKNPYLKIEPPRREVWLAAGVGLALFFGLLAVLFGAPWPEIPGAAVTAEASPIEAIGAALLTTYLVPFEVVSVLLLAVMVGAAYLARPEKR